MIIYLPILEDGCLAAKRENTFLQFGLAKCVLICWNLVSEIQIKVMTYDKGYMQLLYVTIVNTRLSETTSTPFLACCSHCTIAINADRASPSSYTLVK